MLKSNLITAILAIALMAGASSCISFVVQADAAASTSCCCCDDKEDDDNGGCPDLTVDIDAESLDVDCPGGFGTCVTTVSFTVTNIGTADAGAFDIRIELDPAVVLTETVDNGLDATESTTITVMSPPGGNCFNPNCTVNVIVDTGNAVSECDENNNTDTITIIG